ncbi:MAG TPA: hypothetical protein VLE72_02785 [Candidatus Saccharimonadales bacterium]|nr:hypothetical protein [Candidatus Saccharimonadales bacterium]
MLLYRPRALRQTEASIRSYITLCQNEYVASLQSGPGVDPELDRLLLEEAVMELRVYAKEHPRRARKLAEELKIKLEPVPAESTH